MSETRKKTLRRAGLTAILSGLMVCICFLIAGTPHLGHAYLIQRGENVQIENLLPGETLEQDFSAYRVFDHVVLFRAKAGREDILGVEIRYDTELLFSEEIIFEEGMLEREIAVSGEAGSYIIQLKNDCENPIALPFICEDKYTAGRWDGSGGLPLQIEVYHTSGNAKWCYFIAMLMLAALSLVVLWGGGEKWTRRKAAGFILVISLVYLLLFPGWNINDFGKHFATAYAYTNTILGIQEDGPEDMLIREDDAVFFAEVFTDRYQSFYQPTQRSYDDAIGYLFRHTQNNQLVPYGEFSGVHREYGFWNYLPQISGILIARLLSMNLVTAVFLARLCSALFYVALICLALRKLPDGMIIPVTILSCVPVNAMNLTAICYDAPCYAVTLYFFACIFFLREKYRLYDAICLVMCSLAMGLVKRGAYAPLLLSLLLLFRKRDKQGIRLIACCVIAAGLGLVINYGGVLFGEGGNIYFSNAGRGTYDARWALKHPWTYFVMMIRAYLRQTDKIASIIGRHLGWHGEAIPEYVCGLFYVLMILAAILPGRDDQQALPLGGTERIWIWLPVLMMTAMLPATMLSYTKLEWDTIENIQGRYYLPLQVPLLMLCYHHLRKRLTFRMNDPSLLLWGAGFLHMLSVYYIWLAFLR